MDNLTGLLCIVVPLALIVLVFAAARTKRRALTEAREAYQAALSKLKERPTDASRRQLALEAGRHYSALTRKDRRVTIFDEAALKNDLDAATAGAVAVQAAPAAAPADPAARLRRLDELKAEGLLSEAEHAEQRQRILSAM